MKKGLFKGLVVLGVLAAIVSLAGCTPTTSQTPSEPPVTSNPEEEDTVQLLAPSISVGEDLMLQITPSTDAKTVEKTTGYEVSINGETQQLGKDELSLQLELDAGNDVIQVKAIGGEHTESKNAATITVTEEQKAAIAYNQMSNMLKENLTERLNTMYAMVYGSRAENLEILSIGSIENDMTFEICFNQEEDSGVIYQQTITAKDFLGQEINDIFELNSYVKENISTLGSSIASFTPAKKYNTLTGASYLLNGSYINGQNRTGIVSDLANEINNGWEASIVYENRSGIDSVLGNDFGTTRVKMFSTSALVKLEKNGEEDKYLKVSYDVVANNQYSEEELMSKLADGTLPASDIIIEDETIQDQGNLCGIYQDAKAQYEGKEIEMNQGSTIDLLSVQMQDGSSYTMFIPAEEVQNDKGLNL